MFNEMTKQEMAREAADSDFKMDGLLVGPPWRSEFEADPFLNGEPEPAPF